LMLVTPLTGSLTLISLAMVMILIAMITTMTIP
jgi:hypothetical protein